MNTPGSLVARTVYSVIGTKVIESQGFEVNGQVLTGSMDGKPLFFPSMDQAIRAAIRHEGQMEASCDVIISRAQDELKEARRSGRPAPTIKMHEVNIETVSRRRDAHAANKQALMAMAERKAA